MRIILSVLGQNLLRTNFANMATRSASKKYLTLKIPPVGARLRALGRKQFMRAAGDATVDGPGGTGADQADGQSHVTKLAISGVALVPFVVAMGVLVGTMYHQSDGKPLLGKAWKDAILCIGVLLLFFACSTGLMYMQISLP